MISRRLVILLFIIILLFSAGCTSINPSLSPGISSTPNVTSPAAISPLPSISSSGRPSPSSTNRNSPTPTSAPFGNFLSLSPVPKLGETVELTYTLDIRDDALGYFGQSLANSNAWIDFEWTDIRGSYSTAKHTVSIPLSEVLVSGNVTWQGNALENRNAKVIDGRIKLPREGVWKINSYFQINGSVDVPGSYSGGLYLSANQDMSYWNDHDGTYDIWFEEWGNSNAKLGKLEYSCY